MDLLAIERGDEGRLESVADVVADLVAAVLGIADLACASLQDVVRPEHRLEQARGPEDVGRVLDEQVEEAGLAWDEAQPQGILRRYAGVVRT